MDNFVYVNDTLRDTDSASIQAAIDEAVSRGTFKVVIPRTNARTGRDEWIIEETVKLPSGIEVIIDGAHLVLASGKYLNMFSAVSDHAEDGTTSDAAIRNVSLIGRGGAILDGGEYNGLHEKNSKSLGIDIFRNTTLLFFNVDGLRVENLSVINQRWWGITNVYVRNAVYRNINFEADFSRIDENGIHHPNVKPTSYDEVYVKNADGIDLRCGCHGFLIENISGFCEDDSIALTAIGKGETNRGYIVKDLDSDIHDVTIRNVVTDSYCANIRLLCANGHKLYNINIDGVNSLHSDRRTSDIGPRNNAAVRIGDMRYSSDYSRIDEVRNITVRNVVSESQCALTVCNGISDSTFENIIARGGYAAIGTYRKLSESREGEYEYYTATLKNCKIGYIQTLSDETADVLDGYIEFIE